MTASGAAGVNPKDYDLICLAMQEPQYRSPGVRELLDAVAKSKVPCMSIMNMPPLPYVKRIPGLDYAALEPAYTDARVWDNFDPKFLTLCSPDPQAIRPPDEKVNVLMVTLPTNFKAAKFDDEKGTAILRQLEKEIDAIRFDPGDGTKIELPVKLRVYDGIFVPLAKWSMLLAGNYRCVTEDGMRTAQEAVHSDLATSKSVYDFVFDLCVKLGANPADLVPYEKYAAAAQSLVRPASAARALQNGAPNIERADKLVQLIAKQKGLSHPAIDAQVALVDRRIEANRRRPRRPDGQMSACSIGAIGRVMAGHRAGAHLRQQSPGALNAERIAGRSVASARQAGCCTTPSTARHATSCRLSVTARLPASAGSTVAIRPRRGSSPACAPCRRCRRSP